MKLGSELDSELHPDSEVSHGNQRSKSLRIAKSAVALPQFYIESLPV
jgi:hypothetical protein